MEYLKKEEQLTLLFRIFCRENPAFRPRRKARNAEAWAIAARLVINEPINLSWAGQFLCSGSSAIELPERHPNFPRAGEYPGKMRRQAQDNGGIGAAVLDQLAKLVLDRHSPFLYSLRIEEENAQAHAWACAHSAFCRAIIEGDYGAAVAHMELTVEVRSVFRAPDGQIRLGKNSLIPRPSPGDEEAAALAAWCPPLEGDDPGEWAFVAREIVLVPGRGSPSPRETETLRFETHAAAPEETETD